MEDYKWEPLNIEFVKQARVGSIVAVELPGRSAISAKIVRKSTKDGVFQLETPYGTLFVAPFEDILWIKEQGDRWPMYIHRRLQGE